MEVVFWDNQGLIHLESFNSSSSQKGLTGAIHPEMLVRLKRRLENLGQEKLRRGVLLLQDNAPCHKT